MTIEFREFMDRRGCWPSLAAFQRRLSEEGWNKQHVAKMKRGEAVAEKYFLALAKILGEQKTSAHREYLHEHSRDGSTWDDRSIVELISEPVSAEPVHLGVEDDYLARPYSRFEELFINFNFREALSSRAFCRSSRDVSLAVRISMAALGRELEGPTVAVDDTRAIESAERFMKIRYENYRDRTIRLWRKCPNCVLFAVLNNARVGSSIVLPFKDGSFGLVRRGSLRTHECSTDDLSTASNSLFVESIGCTQGDQPQPFAKKTRQVIRMMVAQLALLSNDSPVEGAPPLRIAAVGDNPNSDPCARGFGFRPNGHHLFGEGRPILELDSDMGWPLLAVVRRIREQLITGS